MNLTAAQDEMRSRAVGKEVQLNKAGRRWGGDKGGRYRLDMEPSDPLYEMLPVPEKIEELKWKAPKAYEMPLTMRSTGIQESLKLSHSTIVRQFLLDERKSQCDRQGRNRFLQLLMRLHEIGMSKSPQAVAAINALLDRGFGKIKPSDEEIELNKNRGYKVVHIHSVQGNIPVESDQPALPPAPQFLEAEFGERE